MNFKCFILVFFFPLYCRCQNKAQRHKLNAQLVHGKAEIKTVIDVS